MMLTDEEHRLFSRLFAHRQRWAAVRQAALQHADEWLDNREISGIITTLQEIEQTDRSDAFVYLTNLIDEVRRRIAMSGTTTNNDEQSRAIVDRNSHRQSGDPRKNNCDGSTADGE